MTQNFYELTWSVWWKLKIFMWYFHFWNVLDYLYANWPPFLPTLRCLYNVSNIFSSHLHLKYSWGHLLCLQARMKDNTARLLTPSHFYCLIFIIIWFCDLNVISNDLHTKDTNYYYFTLRHLCIVPLWDLLTMYRYERPLIGNIFSTRARTVF